MSIRQSYFLQVFIEKPWAILPAKLAVLESIVIRHASGEKLDAEEVQTAIHGAARPQERQVETVAVLPLFGTIFPRANLMTNVSGATSAEIFGKQFTKLVDDPEVGAIVLDVNSPGGRVSGIAELTQRIYDARGSKPIVAVANHLMASAAYWIATAADEVVVTPSSEVGSVGVFAVHEDYSAALEQDGIKVTLISAGKYKTEANPYESLSAEAKSAIQESVSESYDVFIGDLARNRGLAPEQVRASFGEGRLVSAQTSVTLGMADRVATLDEVINGLLEQHAPTPESTPQGAQADLTSEAAEPSATDVEKNQQAERLRQRISEIRSQYEQQAESRV